VHIVRFSTFNLVIHDFNLKLWQLLLQENWHGSQSLRLVMNQYLDPWYLCVYRIIVVALRIEFFIPTAAGTGEAGGNLESCGRDELIDGRDKCYTV
jgi:hypothetical protein